MDNYKSPLPYPEISVAVKNPMEAKKLMNDYGGRESETTAIFTYAYQSYILRPDYPEIADVLEKIGIVEMTHHEMLGEAIVALGGQPVIGGRNQFWNGSFVNYTTDLKKILLSDVAAEQLAIKDYERTILTLSNESIIKLIERIILDEECHIEILNGLLKSLS